MSTEAFGLTLLAVGMGGTLLTLAFLAGMIRLLTFLLPPQRQEEPEEGRL